MRMRMFNVSQQAVQVLKSMQHSFYYYSDGSQHESQQFVFEEEEEVESHLLQGNLTS